LNASLQKQVSVLLHRVSSLEIKNAQLERNIAELTAEFSWYKSNRNSHNSHLPPSRDLFKPIAPKRIKKKSNRNPGGQHGHKASRLEKVEVPDAVVIHDVASSCHCGEDIRDQKGEMIRTAQVFDIPRIELRVTEHHKTRKCCPECGRHTSSELPGTLDYIDVQYGDTRGIYLYSLSIISIG
jgi:hypothetical protein